MKAISLQSGGRLFLCDIDSDLQESPQNCLQDDVTTWACAHLHQPCFLGPGVTLRDLFLLVQNDPTIRNTLAAYSINDLLEEMSADVILTDEHDEIEFLELHQIWYLDSQRKFHYPHNLINLRAASAVLSTDFFDDNGIPLGNAGGRAYWSIAGMDPGLLRDIPVRINEYAEILEQSTNSGEYNQVREIVRYPWVTLSQVLLGTVHELTWFGTGQTRKAFADRLRDVERNEFLD